MKMKNLFILASICSITACGLLEERDCFKEPTTLNLYANLVDLKGKPLKIEGVKLVYQDCVETNKVTYLSDKEGKFRGTYTQEKRYCDAPSCNISFTLQDTLDGYFFCGHTIHTSDPIPTISYAKKNYMKLTVVNTDTAVKQMLLHSHIGNYNTYLANYSVSSTYEDGLFDFSKGTTLTRVINSVRDTTNYFHYNCYDLLKKKMESKQLAYNSKDLRYLSLPAVDKDTVTYTLIIK